MLAEFSVASRLRHTLLTSGNRDGGWPYQAGKRSRIEPTCWALLALVDSWDPASGAWTEFAAPHLRWLATTQRTDGLLADYAGAPANFTANGLAACVLAHLREVRTVVDVSKLLDTLVAAKGVSVHTPDSNQNNGLQGWPWIPETFSWLEPTCWCVLALKKAGQRTTGAPARIQEAEQLILNRTCESGGWNFGNASVFGQDLRPYVPTTALALIALQDRRRAIEVERSAAWLRDARLKEPSAMALALTAIWLRLDGASAGDVDACLVEDIDRAERQDNLQTLAMALYALTTDRKAEAFRV